MQCQWRRNKLNNSSITNLSWPFGQGEKGEKRGGGLEGWRAHTKENPLSPLKKKGAMIFFFFFFATKEKILTSFFSFWKFAQKNEEPKKKKKKIGSNWRDKICAKDNDNFCNETWNNVSFLSISASSIIEIIIYCIRYRIKIWNDFGLKEHRRCHEFKLCLFIVQD